MTRMLHLLFAALFLLPLPLPALAQDVSGPARATDGDTLSMAGIAIRLHGIDAVELHQSCDRGGTPWRCGREAADKLTSLVAGQPVRCEQRDIDDYGRIVARCSVGGRDLSAAMVDAGLAIALPHFTPAYVPNEARARDRRIGIWDGTFERPADYRAAHPNPGRPRAPAETMAVPRAMPARPRGGDVFYLGCREVRAAGAAPLYRGQPGYRPEMDGDGDGIACEPYRGH